MNRYKVGAADPWANVPAWDAPGHGTNMADEPAWDAPGTGTNMADTPAYPDQPTADPFADVPALPDQTSPSAGTPSTPKDNTIYMDPITITASPDGGSAAANVPAKTDGSKGIVCLVFAGLAGLVVWGTRKVRR